MHNSQCRMQNVMNKILLIIALVFCFGLSAYAQKDIEATTPDGKIVILKADGTWSYKAPVKGKVLGVTAAGYNALREGMSIAEAVAIIGSQGEITADSNAFDTRTVSMEWKPVKSNGMALLQLIFQGDKLMSKSQVGLK